MIKYSVNITQAAEMDLFNAVNYIDEILKAPQASDTLMEKFAQIANSLSTYPAKHRIIEEPILHVWGIRFVPVGQYLLFYSIAEDTKIVNIVRFLYGKRNWAVILKTCKLG